MLLKEAVHMISCVAMRPRQNGAKRPIIQPIDAFQSGESSKNFKNCCVEARHGQQRRRGRRVRENLPDGGLEDAAWGKVQARSSGSVLPYDSVACLGVILFGYHLGVVNGALEYLAKDLGIAEYTVLQDITN